MLAWLRNILSAPGDTTLEVVDTGHGAARTTTGPVQLRRWGGAMTHRFNQTQYTNVTGNHINEDLVAHWHTLVNRCQYELTTHPIIAGMVDTHVVDVAGATGPDFRLLPKSALTSKTDQKRWVQYIGQAEHILQEWFQHCDYNGELSGPEILGQSIRGLWGTGDFIWQKTAADRDQPAVHTPIDLRLHPIDARRLWHFATTDDAGNRVVLGVSVNRTGRKLVYHIREANDLGQFTGSTEVDAIPARDIVHGFESREPGQIRGVPLLAPTLEVASDLREYDDQVLKAAKQAAASGLAIETKHPNAPFVKYKQNGVVPFKLGGILKIPDGHEARYLKAEQPVGNYVEYRTERLREIGRVAQMPLMLIRLGSEEHSFASARMDSQIYQRSIRREQAALMCKLRGPCLEVLREAELKGLIPERPVPVDVSAGWPRLPHVDPMKEAKARETNLATGVTTLIDEWASESQRPDEVIEKHRRLAELFEELSPGAGAAYVSQLIGDASPVLNTDDETPEETPAETSTTPEPVGAE